MKYWLVFLIFIINTPVFANEISTSPIIIFVSFSMPKESLKSWMQEAEKIHAPIVIRGLVDNSFKATIKKMAELAIDNQGGFQIDPTLFKKFQINQVPAVVVTNKSNCLPTQTCREDYDVIYGNVHLDYALEKIADQNDSVSLLAQSALSKLRENRNA